MKKNEKLYEHGLNEIRLRRRLCMVRAIIFFLLYFLLSGWLQVAVIGASIFFSLLTLAMLVREWQVKGWLDNE